MAEQRNRLGNFSELERPIDNHELLSRFYRLTSIWPSVVKEKTTPIDRNLKIMNKTSVFESDFLTNDSLVPAFVFCRGSQSLKCPAISGIYDLHQTSIGINWIAKMIFDNQRATIGWLQNIFRSPYPGAIKVKRFRCRWPCPVRVSLRQGAEHDHHMPGHPYIGLEPEGAANQAQWASDIWSSLFSSQAAGNK